MFFGLLPDVQRTGAHARADEHAAPAGRVRLPPASTRIRRAVRPASGGRPACSISGDHEQVAPLPIKPIELVAVKEVILMMTGLFIMTFLLTAPIMAVYFVHAANSTSVKLAYYLVGVLFIPLLADDPVLARVARACTALSEGVPQQQARRSIVLLMELHGRAGRASRPRCRCRATGSSSAEPT
ncbi:MAG: hypothetical protein MZU97_01570 [Bacillus subtilis]|nr:hypothetical protein [Bacillus subtilis]